MLINPVCSMKDHIAYVTMNRPGKHNGLDMAMFRDMIATAKRFGRIAQSAV